MRRYDDPVEVRRGATEGPEQFLWRGRLWQVRDVVAHWVETGAWWVRPAATVSPERGAGPSPAPSRGDLLREREVWRVEAARGRAVSAEHDPGFGVFDLVFSWSDGSWRLARALD
ncbi:MAG: DUF6504 family protein [Actinomycetota bacterium]|nr:DUF6504 family protein [Actinomycetota bacterium]